MSTVNPNIRSQVDAACDLPDLSEIPEGVKHPDEVANIYEAIVAIRTICPYVQKNKTMTSGHKFRYPSIDAYLSTVKPWMNLYGIAGPTPINSDLVRYETDIRKRSDGTPSSHSSSIVKVSFDVTHAATNTKYEPTITVLGEGDDFGSDKATSKAHTYALKQALRQLFQVETGEAPPDEYLNPDEDDDAPRTETRDNRNTVSMDEINGLLHSFCAGRTFEGDDGAKTAFTQFVRDVLKEPSMTIPDTRQWSREKLMAVRKAIRGGK